MSPLVKFLLKTLSKPPRILRKKIVSEDGRLCMFGDLVFGTHEETGDVLPFYVGSLPMKGWKYFKDYTKAKQFAQNEQ